jgi:hypothetical protein
MADKVKTYIGIFFIILYIGIGVYCFTINEGNDNSNFLWRVFGVAAFAYGTFRAYRIYKYLKSNNHEQGSE